MPTIYTYRFWGVHEDGTKDLFGLVNAEDMVHAMMMFARPDMPLPDYHRLEIERQGETTNGRFNVIEGGKKI